MQSVPVTRRLMHAARLIAAIPCTLIAYACSLSAGREGPVVIKAVHSNTHGTVTEEIAFGKRHTDPSSSKVAVTPIKADLKKRRLLLRVSDLADRHSREAWVNEGERLIGFPGIGPLGGRLVKIKDASAVFEFGFAE